MAKRGQSAIDSTGALESAANIAETASTRVMLFTREGDVFNGFDLNPTDSLQREFRDAARRFGGDLAENATLVPYTPGRKPDENEIVWMGVDDIPELAPIIASVATASPFELFDLRSREARHLRLLVIALTSPNPGTILFIKATSIRARLGRSRRLAAVMGQATYDTLPSDVLLFDTSFDAIVSNGIVLMTRQASFERATGFLDQAGPAAQQTLLKIAGNLRIRNLKAFESAVQSDVNMIAKLRGIQEKMNRNPAYASAMTMDNIVTFVKNHPELDIELAGPEAKPELVFDSAPQRRWQILKLLDDDYDLISTLTDTHYEANSKSVLP